MAKYKTINLEDGMPRAEQAIKRLTYEINAAKKTGFEAMKIIHGYGSSGSGGRLRIDVREYLSRLVRRGEIRLVVTGEQLSIFDADTRRAFDMCGEIRGDRDIERHNNGVTIVIL